MPDVTLPLHQDFGPNAYSPNPSGPHWANVDEDPDDGDGTFLVTALGREVWQLDVSVIQDGSLITSVRIKSTQKRTTAGPNTYHVGFAIDGTDYFSPDHVLNTGTTYQVASDTVAVNPSDGQSWETKERLERALLVHEQTDQPIGLPRPRLTQCIVIATIVLPPDRPTGTDEAIVSGADLSGGAASGTAAAVAGSVIMAGIAPDGSPLAIAAGGTPAAVAGSGTPVTIALGSTVADGGKPSAIPVPVTPTAIPSGLTPTATAAAVAGSGTGA